MDLKMYSLCSASAKKSKLVVHITVELFSVEVADDLLVGAIQSM